jgi:hypothetical protein
MAELPADTFRPEHWDNFCGMLSELKADGWLSDHHISIAHLDLQPRNILVDHIITGVLKWNSAIFGPRFLTCAPPMWLWGWRNDDDVGEDEELASENPPDEENRELEEDL